jgi:glycine cleavage system H protein
VSLQRQELALRAQTYDVADTALRQEPFAQSRFKRALQNRFAVHSGKKTAGQQRVSIEWGEESMSGFQEDLFYSREHTWVRVDGNIATVGVSDYAQAELGELYSVELPELDVEVEQDEPFGVIESSKSVAELISPVSGEVISVNEDIVDDIGVINSDPYGAGWLIMVELRDLDELNNLLDAEEYREYVGEEAAIEE